MKDRCTQVGFVKLSERLKNMLRLTVLKYLLHDNCCLMEIQCKMKIKVWVR